MFKKSKLSILVGSLLFLCLLSPEVSALSNPFKRGPLSSKTFTYPATYDELWGVIDEILKNDFIPVQTSDQQTGAITSMEFPVRSSEYRAWAKTSSWALSGFCTLLIKVSRKSEDLSQLMIVPDFQRARRSYLVKKGWHDSSKGVFENRLGGLVSALLVQRKYPNLSHIVVGCDFYLDETTFKYYIANVDDGGLGAEQGFRNGDIVLKLDGVDVDVHNFFKTLAGINSTRKVKFSLERKKNVIDLDINAFYFPSDTPYFGFKADYGKIENAFLVTEVLPKGPAEVAGLRVGDILVSEEGRPLMSWLTYYQNADKVVPGTPRSFLIKRDGRELSISITPEKHLEINPI